MSSRRGASENREDVSYLFRAGGRKFRDIGAPLAHKGKTAEHLLERYASVFIYVG